MRRPVLVARADGGLSMGLGHIARSAAVAEAWIARGGDAVFATTSGEVPRMLSRMAVKIVRIAAPHPDPVDLAATRNLIGSVAPRWVLCDGYHFDAEYITGLRSNGVRTIQLLDDAVQRCVADVLLDQNAGAESMTYEHAPWTRVLLGIRYALLRPEFSRARAVRRLGNGQAKRMVVLTGGSDVTGLGEKVIQALDLLGAEAPDATVIRGSGAISGPPPRPADSSRCRILRDPDDVAAVMASADLAVAAAGVTCWELCCLGVPSILVASAPNQLRVAAAAERAGAAISLGWHETASPASIAAAILRLAGDPQRRMNMTQAGMDLVDGQGATRVVAELFRSSST